MIKSKTDQISKIPKMNKQGKQFFAGPVAVIVVSALVIFISNKDPFSPQALAASQQQPEITPTLVAWISSQAEGMISELEAIANANAQSKQFSVVNYIRYLALFEELKVVARKDIDKLQWVALKVKALSRAYKSTVEILTSYLSGLDESMTKIELNEPKSAAVGVTNEWLELYQTINYIATHAPQNSNLAKTATKMLQKSPDGTPDKQRATRYKLKTHAFN